MRLKQKLSAALVVLLIMLHGFPAFAITADDLQEPAETVTIQDNGTPSEPSNNQNEPSDILPEQGASPTEKPASPSDAEEPQESERPETGDDLTEPSPPEENDTTVDTPAIQTPSDAPPEAPSIELKEQRDAPVFSIEPMEGGENPGLYGTLDYIPKNAMGIAVEYSFGGESYYSVDDGLWELNEDSPDASPLTQLCLKLDERPYTVWQSGTVNSLYIRLTISCYDSDDIRTEPIILSNQITYPIPETPPPFTAEIVYLAGGYQVNGHFEDFPPDVVRLRPMYSLDGLEYKAVNELDPNDWWLDLLGTEDEEERYRLENQPCINYYEEPLADYVAGKLDRFYLLLEITTESGVYRTDAAVIERGVTKPIPEGVCVKAAFPFTMRPLDEWGNPLDVPYGQYQITAREGSAAERVPPLLPDTLSLEVQLWTDNSTEMLTSGIVQVPVTWKTLPSTQLMAGQQIILSDAVDALVIPSGTEVATPLGNFLLSELVTFDGDDKGQVHLVIDAVGRDEAPDVSLQENSYENSLDDIGALSLAFRLKPSGATAIKAYSFVEGDEDWKELCDLLARRDLNHNQAMGIYGFVTLLQPNDAPFHDYLNNGSPFLVGLKIEGGTFDGETVVLPWPGDYTPPAGIPEPGGSEGNEGNAGSGDGSGDSAEGGQRPDLPGDGAPPVTVPPPGTSNPPDGSGTPPSTPDPPESAVPSLPDGNATTSPPTDWAENGESTVSPKPPDNPNTLLPTEEAGKDTPPTENQLPTKPGNKETPASTPTEPEVDKAAKLPVWNEVKPQEQTQEQSDVQADTRQTSNAEKTGGLPVAAAVLLLGGGITAVAVVGAGSAAGGVAGTSAMSKLLTALKNFFRRS